MQYACLLPSFAFVLVFDTPISVIRWIKRNQYVTPWILDTIQIWCRIGARFSCVGLDGLSATTRQQPMIFLSSVQYMLCQMLNLVSNKYIWQNLVYPTSWKLHFVKNLSSLHTHKLFWISKFQEVQSWVSRLNVNLFHPRQAIRCQLFI